MKLIFLNIDGVLNSRESIMARGKEDEWNDNPDETMIRVLNYIVERTGAKVVISSTWRKTSNYNDISRLLVILGFQGYVFGSTPIISGCRRGVEIQTYLSAYKDKLDNYGPKSNWEPYIDGPIESFVILDDDSDMVHLKSHLVKVDNKVGLTMDNAEAAIKILNKETK